jgi:hypothetical protein
MGARENRVHAQLAASMLDSIRDVGASSTVVTQDTVILVRGTARALVEVVVLNMIMLGKLIAANEGGNEIQVGVLECGTWVQVAPYLLLS